ncbi:malto-oligosyltrehalose trehalohydrolase [Azospirillum formosense]|uniref:Malto-oligosyltrehalose trehalohydrolase n=1 Tax=Azospirillum formosense TaxID=861533 RepID=A0ABX2KUF1_9PROT|nr:malto-oligosyltrehalose trehalohydrolase [Azospirillum formosense]NUB18997.1 malto-oligosyltrehalose trehalohydrolase [Azospirillum formosense]
MVETVRWERPVSSPPDAAPAGRSAFTLRRCPIGVEPAPGDRVLARVWAPACRSVRLRVGPEERAVALEAEGDGYFSAMVEGVSVGSLYRFQLDDGPAFPDPVSRFQPDGPEGPSQVTDPSAFAWTDAGWTGCGLRGQVVYEMHIGTFTPEGTWAAAVRELPSLAELGVTVLELMPVAEFPGRFGWGYDGVDLFAPSRLYGGPDDMRRFVDRAHALGLAVILDVVYNHFGPSGNFLSRFSPDYFTTRYKNEWGDALNFDGPNCGPVREFFQANAAFWVDEYHLDGLRLDATQQIFDRSTPHIIQEIGQAVRGAARGRGTLLIGENEPQLATMATPVDQGGCGLDALWNDDFHHTARVALTGRNEAYYTDYRGTPQELLSAVKHGFLYQGQWSRWQGKRRGTPACGMPRPAFVTFLQNHDQIANSGRGQRIHALTSPGRFRALTALTLLGPGTPMLFQGQEFAASAPFHYFADHEPDLAAKVETGRAEFLSQFPSLASPAMRAHLTRPQDEETFRRCTLDHAERETHAEVWALHRDLLRLRREDPVFHAQGDGGLDGAVLGQEAFVLRFYGEGGDDRLLLVNLGRDLRLDILPEPLLAPPVGRDWTPLWSSEDPRYGGCGIAPVESSDGGWRLPGHAAAVLAATDGVPDEERGEDNGASAQETHG